MKKYISLILLAALSLSLFSCESGNKSNGSQTQQSSTQAVVDEVTEGTEGTAITDSTQDTSEASGNQETKETESTQETTDEVTEMVYTEYAVSDDASAKKVLNKAVILKCGYNTALIDGVRVASFDEYTAPYAEDGEAYVYLDFVKSALGLSVADDDVTANEYGDKFVSLEVIEKVYSRTLYDDDYGVIVIYRELYPKTSESYKAELSRVSANLLALGNTVSAKMKGDSPVLFLTDEELEFAISKAKKGLDPWASEWNRIATLADRAISTIPNPYTGSDPTQYRLTACRDLISARYIALAYLYTEDAKYLDAAVKYLLAYANQNVEYPNNEPDGMNNALPLVTACDIYAMLYNHIGDADKAIIEERIRTEAEGTIKAHKTWIKEKYYGNQVGNNHLTCHLMGIFAAAYVLEDDKFLTYAFYGDNNAAHFLEMIDRAILMEGDEVYHVDPDSDFTPGEIYDRYRVVQNTGFGYSFYHLKFLTYSSMMLRNNGIDTFIYTGTNGENIELPFEVYADYLIHNDDTWGNGHYTGNSLQRESSLSLYYIAYSVYGNERMADVINALEAAGVESYENELFGYSTPYLFAYFDLF